jgi:hypothetical protein
VLRRVQASDLRAFFQDYAGAQKADTRDDIGDDSCRPVCAEQSRAEIGEGRCADGNQNIRAQPGRPLSPLPLGADQGTKDKGDGQAHERAGKFGCQEFDQDVVQEMSFEEI